MITVVGLVLLVILGLGASWAMNRPDPADPDNPACKECMTDHLDWELATICMRSLPRKRDVI